MSIVGLIDRKGLLDAWTAGQRAAAVFVWIVFMAGISWLAWSAFDRLFGQPPFVVSSVEIKNRQVVRGGTMDITFRVVRSQVCYSRSEGYVIDSGGVRFQVSQTVWRLVSEKLGEDPVTVRVKIPVDASTGSASYRAAVYQSCSGNPLHLVWPLADVLDDVSFEIL